MPRERAFAGIGKHVGPVEGSGIAWVGQQTDVLDHPPKFSLNQTDAAAPGRTELIVAADDVLVLILSFHVLVEWPFNGEIVATEDSLVERNPVAVQGAACRVVPVAGGMRDRTVVSISGRVSAVEKDGI